MFMGTKTQYSQDNSSSNLILIYVFNATYEHPSKLFCGYQQTDSEVDRERQKTQKRLITERKE